MRYIVEYKTANKEYNKEYDNYNDALLFANHSIKKANKSIIIIDTESLDEEGNPMHI